MVAAATENDDDGKNDNPSAVVVKDMAKTVIHICSSKEAFSAFCAVH